MESTETFREMLEAAVRETGVTLKQTPLELATYMSERAAHLSTIAGQPGFDQAVIAERNNVAMRAGLAAAATAGIIDWQIIGLIQGALRVAAAALA